MEQIHEKLRAYFKEIGLSQVEIANQLGISKSAVNKYFIGSAKFGKVQAEKWASTFGLSESFLLTGKGSVTSAESAEERHDQQLHTLTETIHILTETISTKDGTISQLQQNIERLRQEIDELRRSLDETTEKYRQTTELLLKAQGQLAS